MRRGFQSIGFAEYMVNEHGWVINLSKHPNSKPNVRKYVDKDGYAIIHASNKKISKTFKVHRLVAKAFVKGFSEGLVVNHKDGDRLNNHASNLEWISPLENERHARQVLGKRCVGEKASRSKLKTKDILKIRELYVARVLNQPQLAKKFQVSQSQITRIINKRNWSHV